jgi:hypothetical protein
MKTATKKLSPGWLPCCRLCQHRLPAKSILGPGETGPLSTINETAEALEVSIPTLRARRAYVEWHRMKLRERGESATGPRLVSKSHRRDMRAARHSEEIRDNTGRLPKHAATAKWAKVDRTTVYRWRFHYMPLYDNAAPDELPLVSRGRGKTKDEDKAFAWIERFGKRYDRPPTGYEFTRGTGYAFAGLYRWPRVAAVYRGLLENLPSIDSPW